MVFTIKVKRSKKYDFTIHILYVGERRRIWLKFTFFTSLAHSSDKLEFVPKRTYERYFIDFFFNLKKVCHNMS